jgi:hypothetical protein
MMVGPPCRSTNFCTFILYIYIYICLYLQHTRTRVDIIFCTVYNISTKILLKVPGLNVTESLLTGIRSRLFFNSYLLFCRWVFIINFDLSYMQIPRLIPMYLVPMPHTIHIHYKLPGTGRGIFFPLLLPYSSQSCSISHSSYTLSSGHVSDVYVKLENLQPPHKRPSISQAQL